MQLVTIGRISRLHGYQGAIVVTTPSGKESSLNFLKQIWVGQDQSSAQTYHIRSTSWMPKGWKLELTEIETEELARSLIGQTVFANRSDLPPLDKNEYYLSDLEGMTVMNWDTKEVIGQWAALQESAAKQNITASYWLIKTPQGELSVPAVAHFVHQVDPEKRIIWLKNLTELS